MLNSPLFSLFHQVLHFPLFRENYYFPLYFYKFPVFGKFIFFYILSVYFVSPLLWPWCIYASHNAITGRPCTQSALLSMYWFPILLGSTLEAPLCWSFFSKPFLASVNTVNRGHPFMTSTKNHVFDPFTLSTCVHMDRTPSPCGRHEIHTALLKWLVQWPTGPKAEIQLYDSNLFKLCF